MFDVQVIVRDGLFVATCPTLDTEATGNTREEAIERLKALAEQKVKGVVPMYKHMN